MDDLVEAKLDVETSGDWALVLATLRHAEECSDECFAMAVGELILAARSEVMDLVFTHDSAIADAVSQELANGGRRSLQ